jgi:hypothetical protein
MSIPIKPPKREYKILQKVWLPYKVNNWVCEKAEQLGVAPNVFIAKLVEWCIEREGKGEVSPIATVDKIVKVYACPYCSFEAKVRGDLLQHLLDKHSDKLKIEGK